MSVNPGFGGQSFIEDTLKKKKILSEYKKKYNFIIGVDGGVNLTTIDKVYNTGVDVTIVGSGLFKAEDRFLRYNQLMNE